jgi:hypothetical protein
MPLHVPPDGVCRVDIMSTFVDAECVNVLHFLVTPTPAADPDGLALLSAIVTKFGNDLLPPMSNGLQVTSARMASSDGTSTVTIEGGFSSIGGAHDGTPIAASSAAVISWQGVWDYRGGKPRTYLPGLTADRLFSPQKMELSFAASLAADAVSFIESIASIPTILPAFSTVTVGALLGNTVAAAGSFAPYSGATVRQTLGSQRGRLRN